MRSVKRLPIVPSALLVALVLASCTQKESTTTQHTSSAASTSTTTTAAGTVTGAIESLPSPAGPNAAEPFLFTTRDGVALSWLEPVAGSDRVALRFATHRNGQWSAPRTIIERNDLFVNWADFPSVVEDANGALFAHWLQKSGSGTYTYDVRMATSKDGGATWRESFLLNRDGKQSEHGFVTLAALPGGGIGATWLDGRNMTMGSGDHEGHDGGDMTLRYATVSADGTLAEDVELDSRTCECCTTGMAMTTHGPVVVYRDRSAEEIRDISYVRREANGWSQPRPIRVDGWKIDGCPVNGPQIDAAGNTVATAWFTAAKDQQRVYVAFSSDGGSTFGHGVAVDEGKPVGRVDLLMLDARTALVSWLEQTAAGAEIRARTVSVDGAKQPSLKIADATTARAAGFTRIVKDGNHVWFAWTGHDGKTKSIHVARART